MGGNPRPGTATRRHARTAAELAGEGSVGVTVRGECMMPAVRPGSQVTVIRARRYWPGDVVAYRHESGELVLHRVLGYRRWRGAWCLVTRGDRDRGVDTPVPVERVIGRLRGRTALIRRLAAAGRFLALVSAALARRARR